MDDAREEMRKLIDVIEKGAKSTSISQADYEKVKPVRTVGALSANES